MHAVASASYPPQASFTYTPSEPWVNCTVTFDGTTSTPEGGEIISYAWDFGDDETGNGMIVFHSYNQSGVYVVTLNVTDSEGLWSTTSKPVPVLSIYGPNANFIYSPPQPFVNGSVTFDASSTILGWNGTVHPPIAEYEWKFGDNTSVVIEYDPITTHIYQTEGNYTVTLNVTDTIGWWNTTSQNLTIHIEPVRHDVAIINITFAPPVVYSGKETVDIIVIVRNNGTTQETFNVTAAYHNVTTNEWKAIGTQNVTKLYALSNETLTFTINITGFTLYQHFRIMAQTSEISGDTNPPDNTMIDGTIRVKLAGDSNSDKTVDWKDLLLELVPAYGTTIGDPGWNPSCDFNGDGWVDWKDLLIYLTPNYGVIVSNKLPVALFTESAETVLVNQSIYFNASDSYDPDGTVVSYFWDFGDETNATGVTVEHAYTTAGNYTVTLTVTDDEGAKDNATSNKTVVESLSLSLDAMNWNLTENIFSAYLYIILFLTTLSALYVSGRACLEQRQQKGVQRPKPYREIHNSKWSVRK